MGRTTAATQRDLMVTAIKALIPSHLSATRYQHHDQRADFRSWADANPGAAFRKFSIRDVGQVGLPEVHDAVQVWHETEVEFVCAYPNDYRYGVQMRLDQDDVLWEDLNQVDDAIGIAGFATFGDANVVLISKGPEDGGACRFAVARYKVAHWRAA